MLFKKYFLTLLFIITTIQADVDCNQDFDICVNHNGKEELRFYTLYVKGDKEKERAFNIASRLYYLAKKSKDSNSTSVIASKLNSLVYEYYLEISISDRYDNIKQYLENNTTD
jgi:hypothetical protein